MAASIAAIEATALYRLFDAEDRLLYVGITTQPDVRWNQHAYDKPWWPRVADKRLEWYPSRPEARLAEIAAIHAEAPIHNVNGSPWHMRPDPEEGLTVMELKAAVSDYANRVYYCGEIFYINKNGKRVAALVPLAVVEAAERAEVGAAVRT